MFQKTQKTYFWAILGSFLPKLGKNEFSWKKGLWTQFLEKRSQFLNISIIYHHAKNQKKLIHHS